MSPCPARLDQTLPCGRRWDFVGFVVGVFYDAVAGGALVVEGDRVGGGGHGWVGDGLGFWGVGLRKLEVSVWVCVWNACGYCLRRDEGSVLYRRPG